MPRKTFAVGARRGGADGASMRPRPDAAENSGYATAIRGRGPCFNEAAARCRGKHPRPAGGLAAERGFNEAAARCRGKLGLGDSASRANVLLQ